jgi:hypothetical protein
VGLGGDKMMEDRMIKKEERMNGIEPRDTSEYRFEEMAQDPDIQREIKEIEEEFRCTELDGLDDEE